MPEVGDKIKVQYYEDGMELVSIRLVEKAPSVEPEPEPEPEPAPEDETQPEDQTQPEDKTEPEEEVQPEEEPKEEPAEEEKQEEEIIIKAQGKILEGDEANMTCKIELDGNTVEFKVSSDTEITAGYFPQKEDTVEIEYDKSEMTLKSIKLLDRPVPEDASSEEASS